ncbi:MAG: hypothetical protein HKN10_15665 [Myxococcales bacterium]|nr:hypothetical protein [Myxococcales bacterium]
MAQFPAEVRISVPGARIVDGACRIVVRLRTGDDVEEILQRCGDRLAWIEIGQDDLNDVAMLESLHGQRLRIYTDSAFPIEPGPTARVLRNTRPVFAVKPLAGLLRTVNVLASIRFRVHIDASGSEVDAEALRKVTDFFLYNPVLASPIEPLATLLAHVARRAGHTLWETELERTNDAYLDEQDRVTAGRRWADDGQFYGSLEEGWQALAASPLAERLRGKRRILLRERNACTVCRHLDLCRGYLKAVDPDAECTPWQGCFAQLKAAAHRARGIEDGVS